MKGPALLRLITRHARQHELWIEELPKRGKGSHRRFVVASHSGVVARFGITGHGRELSWTVLRSTEETLAPLFGKEWMEER